MKLRIRGNSIRLRLTQTEVNEVREGRFVQATIEFAKGAKLYYVLEPSNDVSAIEARYVDHRVTVLVPMQMALAWALSTKVELKSEQPLDAHNRHAANSGDLLSILIEKDFVCLKPRENEKEDESDMFANPNTAHGNCGGAHG
jgi:hypothetical protein